MATTMMVFNMYMQQYLNTDNIQYDALVSFVRDELKNAGLTDTELDLIDYASFIKPFVDEIDSEEDSWVTIQNKRRIMATIQSIEAKRKR